MFNNLGTIVPKPTTETQARPLAKLPPAQQPEAWEAANKKAESHKFTMGLYSGGSGRPY